MRIKQWAVSDANGKGTLPEWKRRAAMGENGEIYIPVALIGNEDGMCLNMAFDQVPGFLSDKHLYGPLSWLKKTFTEYREVLTEMETKLKEVFAAIEKEEQEQASTSNVIPFRKDRERA